MKLNDRRKELRRSVDICATIYQTDRRKQIECVVENASGHGCHVVSESLDQLEDEVFKLEIDGFMTPEMARLVWREKNRAGVEFVR